MKPSNIHTIFVLLTLNTFAATETSTEEPASPVWIMKEYEHVNGSRVRRQLKATHYMHPLVRRSQDGRISVNLDPSKATDQPMIDLLTPGTGFVMTTLRNEIGQIFADMPCSQDSLVITSETQPVPDLERVIVNPGDKRRIGYLKISGCLEVPPESCTKNVLAEGYADFDYGHLKEFFLKCKEAMIDAIDDGRALARSRSGRPASPGAHISNP